MADQEKNKQLLSGLVAWGCDVPGALVRFLNNEDFYCTLLHSVPEEKGFVELGVALKKKDTNAAFDSAHVFPKRFETLVLRVEGIALIVDLFEDKTIDG